MRFFAGLLGFYLLVVLSNANIIQRRTYRNTEEILVPVTIIQDGEQNKELAKLQENEKIAGIANLQPVGIIQNPTVAAVEEAEQNLELGTEINPNRRIDVAIVEDEIKEAIKEEHDNEAEQILDDANKLKTTLVEVPEIVSETTNEEKEVPLQPVEQAEKILDYKSVGIGAQNPEQVIAVVEDSDNVNAESEQSEVSLRQGTQATPTQTTTQQNFVQQLIQNSPLGQFFNQITGQTTQTQVASDDAAASPVPNLPGLFNPVTAVQTAAQSVVNSTTQAFQGLQQFASNLGNQFQNTLSGLGGQQQDQAANDGTTARPPGPIQQLVNTFLPQPAPAQQGPLQGLLNIFQGNNRPLQAVTVATSVNPDIQGQTQSTASAETNDQTNNEVRDSAEANDSFEESIQPEELIIVNDDTNQTEDDAAAIN